MVYVYVLSCDWVHSDETEDPGEVEKEWSGTLWGARDEDGVNWKDEVDGRIGGIKEKSSSVLDAVQCKGGELCNAHVGVLNNVRDSESFIRVHFTVMIFWSVSMSIKERTVKKTLTRNKQVLH